MPVNPNKYSIYAARDADKSNVNWGKVAQDLNTTLTTVAADKKAKRAKLDADTQAAIENLSQVADIKNVDAQSLLLNGAEMSKENLLLQSDMMKKGLITTKDYMLFLQQQKSGYANLSSAVKAWDKWYQKSEGRLELDPKGYQVASSGEIWANTTLAAFGNLENKQLWTNPNTGQMQLVEMDKDADGNYTVMPDPNKNPEKFLNPNAINSRMNIREDRVVLEEEIKKIVDPLAKVIQQTIRDDGTSTYKEGFGFGKFDSGKPDIKGTAVDESKLSYDQWKEKQVAYLMGGTNRQVQILSAKGYTIAGSLEEFKKNCGDMGGECDDEYWIRGDLSHGKLRYNHLDKDGEVVDGLSKSQKEAAKEITTMTLDSYIDNIVKVDKKPEGGPTVQQLEDGAARIKTIQTVFASKDQKDIRNALHSLMDTTSDTFIGVREKTVGTGTDQVVVSISIPYADANGNIQYKEIKMQEKIDKEGDDTPDNYKAVAISDFIQQVYEGLAMNDDKMPSFDAVKGHINTDLILEDAKLNRGFERVTETEVPKRDVVTGETPVGDAGEMLNSYYEKAITDINRTTDFYGEGGTNTQQLQRFGKDVKKALVAYQTTKGLPASYLDKVSFSAKDQYLVFKLPAITRPDGTVIAAKDYTITWGKASKSNLNNFADEILSHMYYGHDPYTQRTGGQTIREPRCPKGKKVGPGGTCIDE